MKQSMRGMRQRIRGDIMHCNIIYNNYYIYRVIHIAQKKCTLQVALWVCSGVVQFETGHHTHW